MKTVSFVLFLAALIGMVMPGQLAAQWTDNPNINTPISVPVANQLYPQSAPDGAGGAIIAWLDYRNGSDYDVYAQRISVSGVVQWTATGVALCVGANFQSDPAIVSDGSGGAIITWMDNRTGSNYDIYAQRINASGIVQWTSNGVAICTATRDQDPPQIVSDGSGGAIMTWSDHRSLTTVDIYAQRINASGVVQWATDGVAISTGTYNHYAPMITNDGAGGAMITWWSGCCLEVYTQRINASGVVQWTTNGITLTEGSVSAAPRIVSDKSGGAIITWEDYRNGSNINIYAQRVSASGVAQWLTFGVPVCKTSSVQPSHQILADGAGGAIITWQDSRNVGNYDIYAQRINASGVVQWAQDGMAICSAGQNQTFPIIIGDGAGGAIISWADLRNGLNDDIFAQRVDTSGAIRWSSDGIGVSTAAGLQRFPTAVNDANGGAIIVWTDYRSGNTVPHLYAQHVAGTGLLGSGNPKIVDARDNPYDQGGKVNVFWNASPYDVLSDYYPVYAYSVYRGISPQTISSQTGTSTVVVPRSVYESQKEKQLLHASEYFATESTSGTIYWQWVADVPAHQMASYFYPVPTLSDSIPQGTKMHYFMVTAGYNYDSRAWQSNIDSGYSVDNIPPIGPTAVTAQISGASAIRVAWNPDKVDSDVGEYEVHRSTASDFTPTPSTKIGSVRDTSFLDAFPVGGSVNYYRIVTVDIHGNPSSPSPQALGQLSGTFTYSYGGKWNLVSVPLTVGNYQKTTLFPSATSNAFTYQGGYVASPTLQNGVGYWIKFGSATNVPMTGYARTRDTVDVRTGWNMVGSLSQSIPTSQVTSVPGGMMTSSFYAYNGSYQLSGTLDPGKGYWVKVNQNGKLILSTGAEATSKNAITIVAANEVPPSPPGKGELDGIGETPNEYGLAQNYPNPFNPTTEIRYGIGDAGFVTLKVYDVLGREVATLVNEVRQPGVYATTWNADQNASGIYFCRLYVGDPLRATAQQLVETRKLILAK